MRYCEVCNELFWTAGDWRFVIILFVVILHPKLPRSAAVDRPAIKNEPFRSSPKLAQCLSEYCLHRRHAPLRDGTDIFVPNWGQKSDIGGYCGWSDFAKAKLCAVADIRVCNANNQISA